MDGRRRRLRRAITPHAVDDAVDGNGSARVQQQDRKELALLLAAETNGTTVASDLDRPQDPELDASAHMSRLIVAPTHGQRSARR